ncbi:SufB/SufD family protein [Spiroplasma tabanidicola]|uniref:FeS assembly protein SufD n=1 Tax=Spiroplasma tabanidicola TaxID=324079 RepID=A0A6I6CB82_9MOLU|nr:SufD family Fe-S cluster assembly protein [Spiroplasma tabanidicola]QGS52191.1 FeS assembly protein SufD [Spiroplasma tabanidicola]
MVFLNEKTVIDFSSKIDNQLVFENDDKKIIFLSDIQGDIEINIKESCNVNLHFIFVSNNNFDKKTFNIIINLEKYANLVLNIANLTKYDCDDNISINLRDENSSVEYYSASIANQEYKKNSIIKVCHLARNTKSNICAYEVLKNKSKGFIRCISDIKNGSSSSEAHQELRLLVLDKEAKANSDPVLLIDENDIVASHANAIGMLDPDQIFYLRSRGLTKQQSQELILMGYFEPVFINLENDNIAMHLKDILKGMI